MPNINEVFAKLVDAVFLGVVDPKASPRPFPVYRYSSSLEKRAGDVCWGSRRILPWRVDGEGEAERNGEGEREL